jgi:insulysin
MINSRRSIALLNIAKNQFRFSAVSATARPFAVSAATMTGVYNDIVKSAQDDRSYRGLVLENGLKAMLVSDPTTDKSAAALDVHVGHMVDDKELPGLAHFCEHMLFLGTDKYPDETEYSKYLSQHGGGSNAYTAADHTNYYFDVTPKNLEEALDRFSQFFLSPLFTESATDREVNAVNSEHEKNIPSDSWRLRQLECSLCDPEHDFHKFGTGSKSTLDEIPKSKGINVRDELLKFHDRWYSSNIMGLAVLGSQGLDELESMVRKQFSDVKNKNVTVPSWPKHPFGEAQSKTIAYVVPVKVCDKIRN